MPITHPFPYWRLDRKLNVIDCNDLAKSLGRDPFNILTLKDAAFLQSALQSSKDSVTLPLKSEKTNREFWFIWKWKIDKAEIYLTAVDISHIKETEIFYAQILHSIQDLVIVKGPKSRLIWSNKALQEYYGLTNDELKEKLDAPHVQKDITEKYIKDDEWVWQNKQPLTIDCEPITRFDGAIRKFTTVKTPILDTHNNVIRLVVIARDITEKMESDLRASTASKMAALGEMAGSIAHEINNPLTVILGEIRNMKHMMNDDASFSRELIISGLNQLEENTTRIVKIIKGLSKYSRNSEIDPVRPAKIGNIIRDTLALCQSRIEKSGVRIELDMVEIEIECRDVQISQIILNLLNNAFDAIEGQPDSWVKLSIKKNNNFLEVRVQDSGPGVPELIRSKIMTSFFTTKGIGKGTGLGLSLSKTIAREHHGDLILDIAVSPSCFLLTLPLKQ